MSFHSGKTGYVMLNSTGPYTFNKWSADLKIESVSTNNFTSGGFDEDVAGFAGGTIKCSGPHNAGGEPVTLGQIYTFHLGEDEGLEWSGNARVVKITPDNDAEGTPGFAIEAKVVGLFSLNFDGGLAGL